MSQASNNDNFDTAVAECEKMAALEEEILRQDHLSKIQQIPDLIMSESMGEKELEKKQKDHYLFKNVDK